MLSTTGYSAADAPFCDNAIGELHKQFCQVRRVYCGPAVKFLQVALALLSGLALLVAVWAVLLVTTARRTIVDYYLMQLCIGCGLSFLVVAGVWYVFVFRPIIESAYYKDQYNRCATNAAGRKCWGMGTCLYMVVTCAILYPMLSVLVANHVTRKFRTFQVRLSALILPSLYIRSRWRAHSAVVSVRSEHCVDCTNRRRWWRWSRRRWTSSSRRSALSRTSTSPS